MSYVALVTDRFDEVVRFYGELLEFPCVAHWDRRTGRGQRFDLGGLRLEILDNARERHPAGLASNMDRAHVVVEVDDLHQARSRLRVETPAPTQTSWGARLFQVRDPDGVAVTFLEWTEPRGEVK